MWLHFSADYVVVPGKFYIAFLKKREVGKKKLLLRGQWYLLVLKGRKEIPLVSISLFCLQFICVYEGEREKELVSLFYVWLVRALNECVKSPNPTKVFE
jgi:hypothetical protein